MKNKPTSETIIKRLNKTMSQFKARYPTEQEWSTSFVKIPTIKFQSVQRFYVSDVSKSGMAFYSAYDAAVESMDTVGELCTNVGSMLCDVYDGFRNFVEEALYRIGVRPVVLWLPSDDTAEVYWPFILVNFACCIIMLLKKFTDEINYHTFMIEFINELKEIIGYDADLDFPFDFKSANAIRTNLGGSSRLCQDTTRFIMKKGIHSVETDEEIGVVCQYLYNVLAWSEMRHFILINDMLVKAKSPVFFDPRVSKEVNDFTEACRAIKSHICPQFFMYLAPKEAMSKVEPSRFPTLIAVAQELQRKDNNCSTVAELELTSMVGEDLETVKDLVKIHRQFMPHNRCPV